MLGEFWFYHLEHASPEIAAPALLERCLQRGWRALVRSPSEPRLDALDVSLWTFADDSFLPHGRAGRDDPGRQPIWLTSALDNPNGAKAIFLLDGAEAGDLAAVERVSLIFDGREEAALTGARSRWRELQGAGAAPVYWRETAPGRWRKQN